MGKFADIYQYDLFSSSGMPPTPSSSSSSSLPQQHQQQEEAPLVVGPSVNKPILIPVRVEPKVFFANERTFLSWLNFTVVLGAFAVGLYNFGDRISRISAVLFTVTAIIIMLYSLCRFHLRAYKIRKREAAAYDDRIGPTTLCVALALAVAANYYLRFYNQ
ncbi:hypothetical protein BDB00DRAFT_932242 [Zychaea mexicana]|uniref:uncharacterized protein n=1 Tax=Zychaea mexicana TaxID=64656 RepID=UPI0022FE3360|nr:uncharacterized protein BDB00DRAFT_932242 [Zychaea mexicana]KAI9489120.1 hypothetical protein BDB00DRAFT_932242 [Zychaea mexicana]